VKGIYLPDTVERYILPNLKPLTQLVLYKLISRSDTTYKTVWPGLSDLAKKCKIKDTKWIRQSIRELEDWKLVEVKPEYIYDAKKGKRQQTSNRYVLTFEFFENIDIIRGIKFKRKQADRLERIENKIDSLASTQARAILDFEKWCRKNKFSVDVTQPEIDISYLNPFSQSEIRAAANKRGLVLAFKTG